MTRLSSQEPHHRKRVEESKDKRSVSLRRIVSKRADDAVKRLHERHRDSQKRDCHAGTNAHRDQDRQQQPDASRSSIPGEAVLPAWAEQTRERKASAHASTQERDESATPESLCHRVSLVDLDLKN